MDATLKRDVCHVIANRGPYVVRREKKFLQ